MSTRPIVNDALWRCLCPSFQQRGPVTRGLPRRRARITPYNSICAFPQRSISFSAPTRYDAGALQPGKSPSASYGKPGMLPLSRKSKRDAPSLVLLPTAELYERLRSDAAAGRHEEVMNIIKILIKDRRERPNVRLYAAMLHSFVNPEEGTAGKIRKVLEEMGEAGVDLDAGGCHAVLEALAVHPDYLLREEILAYMKERWFSLTDRGHNMVVAGLLRDRLFEQALQKIDEMNQQRIRVQDWLLDKAIWILLDYKEIEEAWHLLLARQQPGRTSLSQPLWTQFLDVAAELCHVDSVKHIWTSRVIPGYLKPPTGTCLHVLNLSARIGDVKLATDVFRVFAERDTILTSYHYEMLLEAYLNSNDLSAAISVIHIMTEAGIKIDESSVHPLYCFLKQDEARPMEAFNILQTAEASGRKIPTASVNACIQASIHFNKLEEAIEIYKALHTVSRAGPSTQTFNILFQGCHKAGRKELAMFLASEMTKLGLEPDMLTYDRLILVCCNASDPEDAFLYYEEMRRSEFVPRRGTFDALIELGVVQGDPRTPKVLEDMRNCGYRPSRSTEASVHEMFSGEAREQTEGSGSVGGIST